MTGDSSGFRDDKQDLIIKLLAEVGGKLQKSEAERKSLKAELNGYRKMLSDVEDKTHRVETAYLKEGLAKDKDISSELIDEIVKRQKNIESRTDELNSKIDKSSLQTEKNTQRVDKFNQDRTRLYRRIEKAEEVAEKAKEAVESKALVVLTDMAINGGISSSADRDTLILNNSMMQDNNKDTPWWKSSMRMSTATAASILVLSIMSGVGVSHIVTGVDQRNIAVMDYDSFARLNMNDSSWQKIAVNNEPAEDKIVSVASVDIEQNDIEEEISLEELTEKILAAPQKGETAEIVLHEVSDQDIAKVSEVKVAENKQKTAKLDVAKIEESEYALDPKLESSFVQAVAEEAKIEKLIISENKALDPIETRMAADDSLPEIIKQVEIRAFEGMAEAQHDLAAIYTAGHGGVKQDYDRAVFWFKEAAAGNIANARYNLGVLYHQGLGVTQDLDKAIKWYRAASHIGHPEARYNLGIAHIEGIGTSYDPILAAAYFEKAAAGGVMEAAYNLGLIYENGLLDRPREKLAVFWYKYAKEIGSVDAGTALDQLAEKLELNDGGIDKLVENIYASKPSLRQNMQVASAELDSRYSETVKQIQDRLKISGVYSGLSDGITGPKTMAAVEEYQRISGLDVDGDASDDLLIHMLAEEMQYATMPASGEVQEGSAP